MSRQPLAERESTGEQHERVSEAGCRGHRLRHHRTAANNLSAKTMLIRGMAAAQSVNLSVVAGIFGYHADGSAYESVALPIGVEKHISLSYTDV